MKEEHFELGHTSEKLKKSFSNRALSFLYNMQIVHQKNKKKLLKEVLEWRQLIDIKMACENTRQIANLLFFGENLTTS